jgi:hypothetical protein
MLRTLVFAITLLADLTVISAAYASCNQASEISTARVRWASIRQHGVDTGHTQESCRVFSNIFFEAVQRRHVASICEEGATRQNDLELLDADIDSFNNLIAAHCGGS